MASSKHPASLWHNLDYLLLWGGQTISTIGTGVSTIAYPLLVLMVTGSPAQAGFISALRALVYVLLVLPAGALLDRWDRKRLSFAQIIIGTLWLTALFWSGLIALPDPLLLGLITALLFFITPFYNTVYISYRLTLTPDALRGRVNSVSRLIGFGLAPIGLALTGILLQVSGPQMTVMLLVVVQVVLAVVATMNMPIRHARPLTEGVSTDK